MEEAREQNRNTGVLSFREDFHPEKETSRFRNGAGVRVRVRPVTAVIQHRER